MSQTRAFTDAGETDADGAKVPTTRTHLDSWQQFELPNGNLLVIGTGQNLDSNLPSDLPNSPPGWNDGNPFSSHDDVADTVKDAEAALSNHTFDTHELTFPEVFEHDEISVKVDGAYSANGMQIQEDGASYRETSNSDWTEKFSVDVPEDYSGRVRLKAEYKLTGGTEGYAHFRLLKGGEVVESVHTDSDTYIEYEYVTGTLPEGETETFKFEIRVVDSSTSGNSGVKTRTTALIGEPEFTHGGDSYWVSKVNRTPMPTQDFKDKVGL